MLHRCPPALHLAAPPDAVPSWGVRCSVGWGGGVCRSEQLEEQPSPTAYAEPWALFTLSLPLASPSILSSD